MLRKQDAHLSGRGEREQPEGVESELCPGVAQPSPATWEVEAEGLQIQGQSG